MRSIYAIKPDFTVTQAILPADESFPTDNNALLRFDGRSKAAEWGAVRYGSLADPTKELPDFASLSIQCLCVKAEVFKRACLSDVLGGPYVELLPLVVKETQSEWLVMNVMYLSDCVDRTASDLASEMFQIRLEFNAAVIGHNVFKVLWPEWFRRYMLCLEDTPGSKGEFKSRVESNKLQGLRFEKMWDSVGGGVMHSLRGKYRRPG